MYPEVRVVDRILGTQKIPGLVHGIPSFKGAQVGSDVNDGRQPDESQGWSLWVGGSFPESLLSGWARGWHAEGAVAAQIRVKIV